MVRVLITSARFSSALSFIRKFGRSNHTVYASDTFRYSPGLQSKYVHETFCTPSPRFAPAEFASMIQTIVDDHSIELIIPSFEDLFYLPSSLKVDHYFAPCFETAKLLHNKIQFLELAQECGINTPDRAIIACTETELQMAIDEMGWKNYFARPAYTRGGVSLLTDTGPHKNTIQLNDCHPTPSNPFVVQEYSVGTDICTCSIVHHGRVVAHSAYVHPKEIHSAGSVVFETVEDERTLHATRQICDMTKYHGCLSLDFIRLENDGTLQIVECNPRPTMGIVLIPEDVLVDSILRPDFDTVRTIPGGIKYKMSSGLLLDMICHPSAIRMDWKEIRSNEMKDVYVEKGDVMPALFQVVSVYGRMVAYWKYKGFRWKEMDLGKAYMYDVCWNGD